MTFPLDLPSPDDLSLFERTWMEALFDLQRSLKAVRDFSMDTEYGKDGNTAGTREIQRAKRFEKMIQHRLSELKQTVTVSSEKLDV